MPDIFEQAKSKISLSLIKSFFDAPGAYEQDGEFFTLSPLRTDKSVGSFAINTTSGLYYDNAHPEHKGDFIDLVSKALNISPKDAAEKIAGTSYTSEPVRPKGAKKLIAPKLPIPETHENQASLSKHVSGLFWQEKFGDVKKGYKYKNINGVWLFSVVRFEKVINGETKKNTMLFYLGTDGKWHTKWHADLQPFTLYGAEKLKDNDLPILVVEGEKCADVKVKGYVVVSWMAGTANMSKSDWSILQGRKIVIWPDSDSQRDLKNGALYPEHKQPGMKAAYWVKSQFPDAKILEIYEHKKMSDNPNGWDIADYIEEGGNPKDFINKYLPEDQINVDIDPYEVYRAYVNDFFDNNSLEQASGIFWNYLKENHYWEKTNKNDIQCNLQRWLELTGMQWIVSSKVEATAFINKVKQYLDRHSLGYIGHNPFKDAAINPYIHMKNGAIEINKYDIKWHDRAENTDDFFKMLYPVNCLDFDFNYNGYEKVTPEKDCPGFYKFAKDLVPIEELEGLTEMEKEGKIEETINFLCQMMAYSLSPLKPNEYFFGLHGSQRTGKSFFIKILKSIIGEKFCIEKRSEDMENRFASSGFWGKKVFIEPDLKTRHPLPEDFIKAYAGEQTITIEEKHEKAQDGVKISIAMFFVSNYEFQTRGLEGLARRLILLPFKNKIEVHDINLLDKITGECSHGDEAGERNGEKFDERPYIMALCMQAWLRFSKNNFLMEIPAWATKEKERWLIEANTVKKFFEVNFYNKDFGESVQRSALYEQYKEWCKEEDRRPLGKKNFFEEVRREPNVEERRKSGYDHFVIKINDKPFREEKEDLPF